MKSFKNFCGEAYKQTCQQLMQVFKLNQEQTLVQALKNLQKINEQTIKLIIRNDKALSKKQNIDMTDAYFQVDVQMIIVQGFLQSFKRECHEEDFGPAYSKFLKKIESIVHSNQSKWRKSLKAVKSQEDLDKYNKVLQQLISVNVETKPVDNQNAMSKVVQSIANGKHEQEKLEKKILEDNVPDKEDCNMEDIEKQADHQANSMVQTLSSDDYIQSSLFRQLEYFVNHCPTPILFKDIRFDTPSSYEYFIRFIYLDPNNYQDLKYFKIIDTYRKTEQTYINYILQEKEKLFYNPQNNQELICNQIRIKFNDAYSLQAVDRLLQILRIQKMI